MGKYLPEAIEPRGKNFRRWQNGDVIGHTRLIPDFRRDFGAPYYVAHRAHFHSALYKRALDLGVEVKTASRVDDFEEENGSLTLADGSTYHGDLVIAADGMSLTYVVKPTTKAFRRDQITRTRQSTRWRTEAPSENWLRSLPRNSGCKRNEE